MLNIGSVIIQNIRYLFDTVYDYRHRPKSCGMNGIPVFYRIRLIMILPVLIFFDDFKLYAIKSVSLIKTIVKCRKKCDPVHPVFQLVVSIYQMQDDIW